MRGSTITGSITTLARRARSDARRAIERVLREEVEEVVRAARPQWPVATGHSKDRLDVETARGVVEAVGRADYTTQIRSRGRRPWFDLIERPILRGLQRMAERASVAATAALRGR